MNAGIAFFPSTAIAAKICLAATQMPGASNCGRTLAFQAGKAMVFVGDGDVLSFLDSVQRGIGLAGGRVAAPARKGFRAPRLPVAKIDNSRQRVEPAQLAQRVSNSLQQSEVTDEICRSHLGEGNGCSQRVGGFTAIPALIRQLGVDPVRILADIGLAPDALNRGEQRIPYAAMGALLLEGAKRTGCSHFGLLCGRAWHVSDLGLVGELVRNSPTVGDALRTLAVYQHLNSGGGLAFLLQRSGVVDLGYAIYAPGVSGASQIYDTLMAAGCNFMRELCGNGWAPSEVFFPHAKPVDAGPHRRLFMAPLRFDAEFCALRFPEHWLDRLVPRADAARFKIAEDEADVIGRGELMQQVYRALRLLLLSGKCSGDDVAQVLAMHRRTLNRRLKTRGATFQEVLDQVRFDVARELLIDTKVVIDDIAGALGYAGVSPFMRSFRRWSGTTPARWRRAGGLSKVAASE
jgi:AraC-like DNA-binding protein